jgi:hypothetical protein
MDDLSGCGTGCLGVLALCVAGYFYAGVDGWTFHGWSNDDPPTVAHSDVGVAAIGATGPLA